MKKIYMHKGVEYLRVEQLGCEGCAFDERGKCRAPMMPCSDWDGRRAHSYIFIENTPEALAEYFARKVAG